MDFNVLSCWYFYGKPDYMVHMECRNLHLDRNIIKCMVWYKVSLLMGMAECWIIRLSGKTAHIEFFMPLVTKCLICPREYYIILNLWHILMHKKCTRWVGSSPSEMFLLSTMYAYNVEIVLIFLQILLVNNEVDNVGRYLLYLDEFDCEELSDVSRLH